MLMQNCGMTTKSIMVCYGNFLSGQLTPFLSHKALQDGHTQFRASLDQAEDDIMMLRKLDRQIKSYNVSINP